MCYTAFIQNSVHTGLIQDHTGPYISNNVNRKQ